MKKIISILMCVVLLLSVMPVVSFSADIRYEYLFPGRHLNAIVDAREPVFYYAFEAEQSGYYSFYSTAQYDDTYVYCYDENHNEIGFDDDSGTRENFAYNFYIEKGTTYYFEVSAVLENSDCWFKVAIERLDGETTVINADGSSYDVAQNKKQGRKFFEFTPTESGYYAFYSENSYDAHAVLYDSEWNYIDEDNDSGEWFDCYLTCYLEEGEKYYFSIFCLHYDLEDEYTVKIEPCEVISQIDVVSYPDRMTYYDGYVEETMNFKGLELEFIYTDGKTARWEYKEDDDFYGATVDVNLEKDDEGKYYISVYADFAYTEFDINVVENPVESISVYSMPEYKLYENVSGDIYYSPKYDTHYFIYWYNIPRETVIQVNYKDGTTAHSRIYDKCDGMHFKRRDNQSAVEPWTKGFNPVTIEFYGKECELYIEVIEPKKGDSDLDFDITIMDATAIQIHLAEIESLGKHKLLTSDVDNDGEISVLDATKIQMYIAELIGEL